MTAGINDAQIEQMSKTIFRFCLSRTGSYHDAEDLAQEIMLVACKSGNHFENEKVFYAFVWKTASNILKSWYRRQAGQRTVELDEKIPDRGFEELEEAAQDHEQLRRILRKLAGLSSDYRRVSVAYYIDGQSVREIAGRFSLSESMVKYLLFQSRKHIREGINMVEETGRLSYDPVELSLVFWGGRCRYSGIFNGNRLRQNIVMACYYDRLTEEQLSLQLGVPTGYLEDDLKKLAEYDLLKKKGLTYQGNIVIVTKKEMDAIGRYSGEGLDKAAAEIRAFADGYLDELRALGFHGSGMPANSLKWMLVSLILRKAYVELLQQEVTLDYPTDIFGDRCFRFLMETEEKNPYYMGISGHATENGAVYMWDVPLNGEMLHPNLTPARACRLISLTETQPETENDRLVCAELIELGLAKKDGDKILPNFASLDAAQSAELTGKILPVARNLCDGAKGRIDGIARIMAEHAPEHLADYAKRLPPLLQLSEAETIMRILCEDGWLLPVKDSMSATTVILRNK